MPFCPSCGTSADGKFCPKCGTAIGVAPGGGAQYNAPPQGMGYNAPPPPPPPGYAPPPPGYAPPPPGYQQQQGYQAPPQAQQISAPGLASNIASMLCYIIPVICPIVFLVVDPYKSDRKIRFDAFQSIFLWVGFIALRIGFGILVGISYHLWFLFSLLGLAEFAISVLLAIKAYQGQSFSLPVIGPIAEKQA
jgi:uncharacterized membrane protein